VAVKRLVALLAVIGAISAGTAGGVSAGNGAERIPVDCASAYHPLFGFWNAVAYTSDFPPTVPIDPLVDAQDIGFGGHGTGVFTPSGNMEVTCQGHVDDPGSQPYVRFPFRSVTGSCVSLRGGEEFGHGARAFAGEGKLVFTPSGNVTITCHGSFVGVLP
jgi:hypothetical protein